MENHATLRYITQLFSYSAREQGWFKKVLGEKNQKTVVNSPSQVSTNIFIEIMILNN